MFDLATWNAGTKRSPSRALKVEWPSSLMKSMKSGSQLFLANFILQFQFDFNWYRFHRFGLYHGARYGAYSRRRRHYSWVFEQKTFEIFHKFLFEKKELIMIFLAVPTPLTMCSMPGPRVGTIFQIGKFTTKIPIAVAESQLNFALIQSSFPVSRIKSSLIRRELLGF